jgi:hypothetical protein
MSSLRCGLPPLRLTTPKIPTSTTYHWGAERGEIFSSTLPDYFSLPFKLFFFFSFFNFLLFSYSSILPFRPSPPLILTTNLVFSSFRLHPSLHPSHTTHLRLPPTRDQFSDINCKYFERHTFPSHLLIMRRYYQFTKACIT